MRGGSFGGGEGDQIMAAHVWGAPATGSWRTELVGQSLSLAHLGST